jgi:Ca2+-binding RTX toxin-like protein
MAAMATIAFSAGWGRDTLFGDNGNDVLDGGEGNDILAGGHGNDILQFGRACGTDTITDFKVGNDHIQLLDGLTLASKSGVVSDVDGDGGVDDTTLTLVDGAGTVQGTVEVLGVSNVADWSALLV